MAASINDKITDARKVTNPVVTTVSVERAIGATSLVCTSLSGWPTATAVHFITYKKTAAGAIDKATQSDWKGIVSSNTIGTLTWKGGLADAGNAVGDFVEMGPTAAYGQDLADGLEAEHNADGTHKAVTATSVTATGNVQSGGALVGDTISEKTAATGVTIDSMLVKDGKVQTADALSPVYTTNPYKFSVYHNTTQSRAANSKIIFNTENFDTGNNFDSVTNNRFTAPVTGFYFFSAEAYIQGLTDAGAISLYKNNSLFKAGTTIVPESSNDSSSTVNGLLSLAANDYVEVFYTGTSTRTLAATSTNFFGFLVSAT